MYSLWFALSLTQYFTLNILNMFQLFQTKRCFPWRASLSDYVTCFPSVIFTVIILWDGTWKTTQVQRPWKLLLIRLHQETNSKSPLRQVLGLPWSIFLPCSALSMPAKCCSHSLDTAVQLGATCWTWQLVRVLLIFPFFFFFLKFKF